MSTSNRAGNRARHGSRGPGSTALRATAAATAAVLGFGIVFGATYVERLQHSFDTQDISGLVTAPSHTAVETPSASPSVTPDPIDTEAGAPIDILLVGSDSRAGANGAIGGKVAGGMRSDTTMIMHISGDRSRIDFLSIPRDMRVRVSNCKLLDGSTVKGWTGKFNIAFANGGKHGNEAEAAACTMQTIQDLTGITFEHYAVVDFAGFENMINSVGGVPMCIEKKIDDRRSHLHLKPGPSVLSGRTALAYARVRHIGDGTDLQRIERQHALMNNLAKKVLGMNVLADAPQLTLLLKSAGESMTMDPDLGSFSYLVGLSFSLRNIDQNNITFATVPWKYAGDKSGDVLATPEAKLIYKRLVSDIPMNGGTTEAVATTTTSVKTTSAGTKTTSVGTKTTPAAHGVTGTSSPAPTPTPERLTQDQILAACATS